jgi:hypothetical protein
MMHDCLPGVDPGENHRQAVQNERRDVRTVEIRVRPSEICHCTGASNQ